MIEPSAYRDARGLSLEEGAYISIIGKGTNDDFWVQVKKVPSRQVKIFNEQLGYKGKKAVKVVYSGPSDKDNVDEQVNILDEELSRYPAAMAISIADAKACEVQFDQAGWNGTPIVTFDSSSDYPGISAFVSTDNSASATESSKPTGGGNGGIRRSHAFYAGLEIAGSPDKGKCICKPDSEHISEYHDCRDIPYGSD